MLFTCVLDCWQPTIGDPSVMGWFTVVAYAVTAIVAFSVAWSERGRLDSTFWIGTGVLLAFLAINKQLDLQSALTASGRCVAQIQGWYQDRRQVQALFIFILLLAITGALVVLIIRSWRRLPRIGVALVGLVFLAGFVAIRAVGFHHMDSLIGFAPGGIRMNWIFELGGIGIIALNMAIILFWPNRSG